MNKAKLKNITSSAKELLEECVEIEEVTAKAISDRANVNPAMINYYFGSKDELIQNVLREIVNYETKDPKLGTENPRKVIFDYLFETGNLFLLYEKYSKLLITTNTKIISEKSSKIYPVLMEYFGSSRLEIECKIISYNMVCFIVSAFSNISTFNLYSDFNIYDINQRRSLISKQLEIFLGDLL